MPTSATKRAGPYAPRVLVDLNKDLVVPKAVTDGPVTNAWGKFEPGSSGIFLESFGAKLDVVIDKFIERIVDDEKYSVEVGFAVTESTARKFDELFAAAVKGIEKQVKKLNEGDEPKSKVGKALIHPLMAINTLGPLRIINRPGKVQKIGQMETNMLAPSRMTNKLAKAPLNMPMGIDMLENFLITKNREKAHSLIVMVTPISVRFEMIFSMAKARIATLMAVNTSGLLRLA